MCSRLPAAIWRVPEILQKMSARDTEIGGFLDVKSTGNRHVVHKVRKRALPLSRVWKRRWCTMRGSGPGTGVQVQFDVKLGHRGGASRENEKDSSVTIPPNAVVHRVRSRTKQFAFCILSARDRKPLLSLSANSETETQRWMADIRHLLKPRGHRGVEKSHDVSMVDNAHSRAAGLTGLYGDLIANEAGIFIRNVHTGDVIETFEWKEFSQFHLMAAGRPEDVKRICVIHTNKDFRCGVGELYVFCFDANKLLQDLVTQGRGPKHRQRSNDEDLETMRCNGMSSFPLQLKSDVSLDITNTEANCLRTSICKAVENIYQLEPNLVYSEELESHSHGESNISITSGIYEEIKDDICSPKPKTSFTSSVCEGTGKIPCNLEIGPPALPPRQKQRPEYVEEDRISTGQYSYPEISNHFEARLQNTVCRQETPLIDHSSYIPMSPQLRDLNSLDILENSKENDYLIMR